MNIGIYGHLRCSMKRPNHDIHFAAHATNNSLIGVQNEHVQPKRKVQLTRPHTNYVHYTKSIKQSSCKWIDHNIIINKAPSNGQ